jgi:hypothetical protein
MFYDGKMQTEETNSFVGKGFWIFPFQENSILSIISQSCKSGTQNIDLIKSSNGLIQHNVTEYSYTIYTYR